MSEREQQISSFPGQAHRSWWVSFCRWLWRVLGFVWGTLIVGIVIGTIANLNTTTADTPLAKFFIVHLALTYPLPIWSGLGLLAVLTLLSWLGSRDKQATPARPLSDQDRAHMLRRLRVRYEQILAQSLQGAVQLELGLTSRPAAVQNAVSLAWRLPDQPEQPLPPHTPIIQVYEQARQELLILGEPGAGKSTLLLELACFLVEQAERDVSQPLPILLPLATWAEHKYSLEEWLGREIARLYDISPRLSQQWIHAEQVLPLLDGLDEMEEIARPDCIAAINVYHRDHLLPLVVCSRTSEYDAATRHERLVLHTAVVVQPLEATQVNAYLAKLGKPLAGLRATLRTNATLQELATTPLILQVLMLTYQGRSAQALSQHEALVRKQIWSDYIQRMVRNKGDVKRYPLTVTIDRLTWLASEMRQHNQAIFSLESLRPDWLPTRRSKLYRGSVRLVFGLIFGLVAGLFGGLVIGPLLAVVVGAFTLSGVQEFTVVLITGLAFLLVFGFISGLSDKRNVEIEPAEKLTWSWEKFSDGVIGGLIFGLVAGLIFGLFGGLAVGLVLGLLVLVLGLLGGLVRGLSGKQLTERFTLSPNEGIHRSLDNGLLLFTGWLIGGLSIGLLLGGGQVVGPIGAASLSNGQIIGLSGGLLGGLAFGLNFGLRYGLDAVIRHYILRFWLARCGVLPWRAVPFLEDATARILLRRVGGGYSFAHRLLLDFFADASSDVSSLTQTTSPSAP